VIKEDIFIAALLSQMNSLFIEIPNFISGRMINKIGVVEKLLVQGLFKNAQMLGAQKPDSEAYMNIR